MNSVGAANSQPILRARFRGEMARARLNSRTIHYRRAHIRPLAVAHALAAAALSGCGGGSVGSVSIGRERAARVSYLPQVEPIRLAVNRRAALVSYLPQVEPIRLAVNRLLEGADPILLAYHDGRISAQRASFRMGALERHFAAYTVDVSALQPATAELRSLNGPYTHTYIVEDAYLSALTTGLAARNVDGPPDTQAPQRAAIIQWRTDLTVLARRLALDLPGDLQAAGRGEIAPSPGGS
jgi:hypothetical protein